MTTMLATARVQVTIEIALPSTYGGEWTIEAALKDATSTARVEIARIIKGESHVKMASEPTVKLVAYEVAK